MLYNLQHSVWFDLFIYSILNFLLICTTRSINLKFMQLAMVMVRLECDRLFLLDYKTIGRCYITILQKILLHILVKLAANRELLKHILIFIRGLQIWHIGYFSSTNFLLLVWTNMEYRFSISQQICLLPSEVVATLGGGTRSCIIVSIFKLSSYTNHKLSNFD